MPAATPFLPPRESKGPVAINPALPPAARPQGISRETKTPRPRPRLQQKEGERREARVLPLLESGLDWTGLATGRERGATPPLGFLYATRESKV